MCRPFFDLLNNRQKKRLVNARWHSASSKLKIIVQIPTLQSPVKGGPLILCVASYECAVSVVLITDEAKQKSRFFHSKRLQEVETRYSTKEKLSFAGVLAARRLRHTFKHTL